MKRRDATATITYTWEPEGRSGWAPVTYEFNITGTVSPYVPASMYGGPDHLGWPEEGGDCEITRVELFRITDDKGEREPTVDEHFTAEKCFENWILLPAGAEELKRIEKELCAAAAGADERDEDREDDRRRET